MTRNYYKVQSGRQLVTAESECFPDQSFPAIPLYGAAHFPRDREAKPGMWPTVLQSVNDEQVIRDRSPPLINALELQRVLQAMFAAKSLIGHWSHEQGKDPVTLTGFVSTTCRRPGHDHRPRWENLRLLLDRQAACDPNH